ncbi:MAG: hypothetical protein IT204_24820 [Fimbriimonadaceae bacterium]|nr:hypothetical protein [Fimbriimonadaceae bacterium]
MLLLTACVPRDATQTTERPAGAAPPATPPTAAAAPPTSAAEAPPAAAETALPNSSAAPAPPPSDRDAPPGRPAPAANATTTRPAAAAPPAATRPGKAAPQVPGRTTVTDASLGLRLFPRAKQGLATVSTTASGRTTIVQLSTSASVAEAHAFYEQALGQPLLANSSRTTAAGRTATLIKVHPKVQFTVSIARVANQTLITILRTDKP